MTTFVDIPDDDFSNRANVAKNQAPFNFVYKGGNTNFGQNSQTWKEAFDIKIDPVTTFNPNTNSDPNSVPNSIGRRLMNPLGYFASYTYNIQLYMLSPDAYDAFLNTGKTNIEAFNTLTGSSVASQGGGAVLIAQSGGIGPEQNRAPGMNLDYYIDDLVMQQYNPARGTGEPQVQYKINFNIYEPFGFSFLTELKNAQDQLFAYSSKLAGLDADKVNSLKMQYVLGIKFYGYDIAGNPIQGREGLMGGIDPNEGSLAGGLFQRYFDITISKMTFKLGKGITVYEVEAVNTGQLGLGLKYGHVPVQSTVEGSTILDILYGEKGLITVLNTQQLKRAEEGYEPINYYVKFMPGAESLADMPMWYDGNNSEQKYNGVTSGAKTTEQSNPFTEFRSFPDNSTKTITIVNDTPIIRAIENIIKESSFLTTSLLRMSDNYEAKKNNPNIILDNTQPLYWFTVTPELGNARWDPKLNSWAYDILYMIEKYEVPFLYLDNVIPGRWYGIQKAYRYYFTGQNTEVISYEQRINLGYTINIIGNATPTSSEVSVTQRPSGQSTATTVNQGLDAQNSVLTQLYDDVAFANVNMTIMGDPDYLSTTVSSIDSLYNQFYGGDGFTIKPTGGQNLIEIVFFEGKDYDTAQGIMNVNRNLGLTTYQDSRISQGLIYQVVKVVSKFSKGKFTQDLSLIIEDPAAIAEAEKSTTVYTEVSQVVGQEGTTNGNTGLLGDKPAATVTSAPFREGAGLINPVGLGTTNNSSSDDNNLSGARFGPTQYDWGGAGSNGDAGGYNNPFSNPLSPGSIGSGLKGFGEFGP